MVIGSRIRSERIKRKWSQETLGDLIGVSKVAISKYERGLEQPKMQKFEKLVEILELTPNYLLGSDIDVICEDDSNYHKVISKMDLDIINNLKNHNTLYKKLCDDPKRTIDLIELKLNK